MSVTFNGTSSVLTVASKLGLTGFPYTQFLWINPANSTQDSFPLSCGSSTANDETGIYVNGSATGKVRSWIADGSSASSVVSTNAIAVSSWQPIMAVYHSATSCDIYYGNGAVVNGNPSRTPLFSTFARFYIGARAGYPQGGFFNGSIAEPAVWSTDLTQSDFDSLRAGAAPETIQAASLLEHWTLLTQASSHTGDKGFTLTNGATTTQGATHPITRAASGTTISTTPGNAAATGAPATIQGSVTIATVPGNAAATGAPATIITGSATTTITTTPGNAAATGATASVGTYIQTDVMPNNTELSILANTAVVWTWTPSGRVGSMVGLTPVDGTGTTDANGRLAPGIALASGRLSVAVRNASAKQDDIFEQYY